MWMASVYTVYAIQSVGALRWLPRHCVGTAILASLQLPYLSSSWRSCGDTCSVEMVQIDAWRQTAPSEWIPLSEVDQGFASATRVVGLMGRTSQHSRGPESTHPP